MLNMQSTPIKSTALAITGFSINGCLNVPINLIFVGSYCSTLYNYIRLTAFFHDNLSKTAPERQNHSGF